MASVTALGLDALGRIVDSIGARQPLSPFEQAIADGPLGAGVPVSFAWLLLGRLV